jgi:hypothetical protein
MSSTSETNAPEQSDPSLGRFLLNHVAYPEQRCDECSKLLVKNGQLKCPRCRTECPVAPEGLAFLLQSLDGSRKGSILGQPKFWCVFIEHSNEPENGIDVPSKTSSVTSITTPYGDLSFPHGCDVQASQILMGSSSERVISFGDHASDAICLDDSDQEWHFKSPFGELRIPKSQNRSCSLTDLDGRLCFVYSVRH